MSTIFASVSSIEICLLFDSLLERVYFTPVDLEILNFKFMRQDLKLRNSVLFYKWEDARVRVHHREWLEWLQSNDCQVADIPLPQGSLAHAEGLQSLTPLLKSSPLGHE